MNKPFDIRVSTDRIALANHLPTIDNKTFDSTKQDFIDSLASLATYLKNPDWMIYQWGAFYPIPCGEINRQLDLNAAIELGTQLRTLSNSINFKQHLDGFFNPTQFQDTIFETQVAYLFASLPSIKEIRFAQEHLVRDSLKKPDFDAVGNNSSVSVECKRPHMHIQEAVVNNNSFVNSVGTTMEENQWPDHLRLEIEILKPFRESIPSLASKVVETALMKIENQSERVFLFNSVHVHVLLRSSPFKIKKGNITTGKMILNRNEATKLDNPKFTALRVTNNRLDNHFAKSIGSRVNKALTQLPSYQPGYIFIGDVPFRILELVCKRRLEEPAYKNVKAFGVWDNSQFHLFYRPTDGEFIHDFFRQ